MRVLAVQKTCIGAGQCVFAAPDTFDQDDNGIVVVVQEEPGTEAELSNVRQAVNICPSRSLMLVAAVPAQS